VNMTRAEAEAEDILQGSRFIEDDLAERMRAELVGRLADSYRTGTPLRVYAGYDASRPNLHIGHTITMRKLRVFQELGHEVIFLVGTLTAQIGDPTDRLYDRPRIPLEQVAAAAATFVEQMASVLDADRTTVVYNGDWLTALTLSDLMGIASAFTVQNMIRPAAVRDRLDAGRPVGLHELLYPLMQGYDALHLRADVQLGTVGPIHNILAGRRLQKLHGQRPCVGITYPALWGTRGHRRMSKREGTHVALTEDPQTQFAKVMSIDDETMRQWVRLISSWSPTEVRERLDRLDSGELHPMRLKLDLAADVVRTCHDDAAAAAAQSAFERRHQRRTSDAADAVSVRVPPGTLLNVVAALDVASSRQDVRRLLRSGSIRVNDVKVFDEDHPVGYGDLLSVGRKHLYVLQP
jgi:tyrosyl-tRNA synthetase